MYESLEAASAAIYQLRRDLDGLRESMAARVSTREIVVTDPNGVPYVLIQALESSGTVAVLARRGGRVACSTELFASDARPGEPAFTGLTLVADGNARGGLELLEGELPELWVDG